MNCPEDLLLEARRGTLSIEARAELDAHLAGCASCRLLLRAGLDMDEELEPTPGDQLIAARIAKKLTSEPRAHDTPRPARRMRPAVAFAVAAAILAVAGLAAAASLGLFPSIPPAAPPAPIPTPTPEPLREAPAPEVPPVEAPIEAVEPIEPTAPEPPVEDEPDRAAPTAAELFAQGNARRREGDPRRARALYRELQRRFPRSPEAEISYVSLGRVLLELGDPSGALSQFDRYLARPLRGPLTEEALFGRASALGRLGRSADERRTWQELLEAFPSSVYADRARARLDGP